MIIQNPKKNLANHFKEFCELQTWVELDTIPESDSEFTCSADESFVDEMTFQWQGHEFHLFEIPGHSQGSIGILLDNKDFFSGDSLMVNCEIELRTPGGSRKKWREIGSKRIEATVPTACDNLTSRPRTLGFGLKVRFAFGRGSVSN